MSPVPMHDASLPAGVELHLTESGMPYLDIRNAWSCARILLQGAQVLSWIPANQAPVLWLSPLARIESGKSPRGGVPICWPWFGSHDTDATMPAHGFARTTDWTLTNASLLTDGSHRVSFILCPAWYGTNLWNPRISLRLHATVGRELYLELGTHNDSDTPFVLGEALHAYFRVGDIDQVRIVGLENLDYLDKVEGGRRKRQTGAIVIDEETDRIYLNTPQNCVIEDSALKRRICIRKNGGHSTIVWNPWEEKARHLGDLGDSGYRRMVCVESGNVADDRILIEPGATHWLKTGYSVDENPEP